MSELDEGIYKAKILADSQYKVMGKKSARLITYEVTLPRIVLSELNTHKMISKNSASSRAIPVKKMIDSVKKLPYIPRHWGQNQRGMVAEELVSDDLAAAAQAHWVVASVNAVKSAEDLAEVGIHKQITNRLLEPFMLHTVILTATEYSNFFNLRCHPEAHPDIRRPAELMRQLYHESEPTMLDVGEWHLPLTTPEERQTIDIEDLIKISVGRCARVSYLTHDGRRDLMADVKLYDRLLSSGHMCYDSSTEVLTRSGWKFWPEVSSTDELLAVDIDTEKSHWEVPSHLHRYAVDEELYHVYGQQVDLKVTQHHRMVVSTRKHGGKWTPNKFVAANLVDNRPVRYLKATSYTGSAVPELPWDVGVDFFKLLGFAIGDGYTFGGNQIQFHLKKNRKVAFLKSLDVSLVELKNDKYVVNLDGLGTWFRENCYGSEGEKQLPDWVLSLPKSYAEAILEGLKQSDGSNKRNTWVFSSTSKQVVDTVQALLALHGQSGSITSTSYGDRQTYFRVNVSSRVRPRVECSQSGRSLSYKEEWVPYQGFVYCATVSTGAVLVRRNGKVVVSGNSPFEHVARVPTASDMYAGVLPYGIAKTYALNMHEPDITQIMFGNLRGWMQHRKLIPGEQDMLSNGS